VVGVEIIARSSFGTTVNRNTVITTKKNGDVSAGMRRWFLKYAIFYKKYKY